MAPLPDAAEVGATCTACESPSAPCKYHKRIHFQPTVKIAKHNLSVDRGQDGQFHCSHCNQYQSQDPQQFQVRVHDFLVISLLTTRRHLSQRHYIKCVEPPASSSSEKPALSPLPPLTISELYPLPDEHTVTKFEDVELLKYNVCVNTLLGVVICLECRDIVHPPESLIPHVRKHLSHLPPLPSDLTDKLITTYTLSAEPTYPSEAIPPVYGLDILPDSKIFCSGCHRGYSSKDSLRAHSFTCKLPGATSYVAYAQEVKIQRSRYIPVKVDQVCRATDLQFDFMAAYTASITPLRDVQRMPLTVAKDTMTFEAFYHREGWLELLEGHTPENLAEARRSHLDRPDPSHPGTPIELIGPQLRSLSRRFLGDLEEHIKNNTTFGLMNYLGQAT